MRRNVLVVLVGVSLSLGAMLANSALASDWLRFRGPNGSGVSTDEQPLPVTWSDKENLQWKAELPGPGSSCPIVVGDRVLVTCWSGYGADRQNPGDIANLKLHLICFNRATGEQLWSKDIQPHQPEERYGGMFAEHGYASHTPVSDGERVYVFFGKTGAMAFDLDGKELWRTPLGTESDPRGWGTASSPILYKNLVIVTAAAESNALVALDKETGKEVWRQEAEGLSGTWGTPVLVEIDPERTDLVLGVPYEIWGINPDTGKLRWFCTAMDTNSYCSSVVTDGEVVYGMESMGGGSIAVRTGGKGDVTQTHVVWSGRDNNRIGTPVVHDGRIYYLSRRIANCVDAKTGERIYQSRLTGGSAAAGGRGQGGNAPGGAGRPGGGFGGRGGGMGGQDYSSPIVANGKIYYVARNGDAYVLKLGPEFEQLAMNRVTSDTEDFSASPAVSEGQLFIRSSKHLYCIAEGTK